MNLNLITLATVKTQLGITGTDSDDALIAMIPIVSADVRKIMNDQFNTYTPAAYTSGSNTLDVYQTAVASYSKYMGADLCPLEMGVVISGTNIPDDTYIIAEDPDTGNYSMSANATGSGDYVYPTINISQWPTISKMIKYRATKATAATAGEEVLQSRSFGPVSVNFGAGQINKRWNYPQTLIDDLGYRTIKVG